MPLDDPLAVPPPLAPAAMPPPSAAVPRWLRWLLIASLALNLLILGLVAGDAAMGGRGGHHMRPGEMVLGPVAAALSPRDKAAILRDLRGRADVDAFGPRAREAAFAEVATALRAEPFRPEALEAALAAQLARLGRAEDSVRDVVVAHIAAMSPEDRAAFADRLQEAARHRDD